MTTPSTVPPSPPAARRKAIVAANFGTFVEFFDFGVYGIFATVLAKEFFPNQDGLAGLLATFAVFTVSYVFRPIGALLFGHLGDRLGRTRILALVILMMSGATFLMGLVPSYATIGVLAPLLMVVLRAVQGMSTGGEWGGSASFLAEYAPAGKRGFVCGLNFVSVLLGTLLGLAMGAVLSLSLSPAALSAWGWRLPFLLALPLGLIGLYMRLKLDETPEFRAVKETGTVAESPLLAITREHRNAVLAAVGITVFVTASTFTLLFMAAYLPQVRGLKFLSTVSAVGLGFGTAVVVVLASSTASDRFGRRPVMIAGALYALVFTYPAFLLVQGGYAAVLLGLALLGSIVGFFGGPFPAAQAELFPTRVRYSGLSVGYGVASSIFGGLTPVLLTLLLQRTGSPLAPAFYGLAAAVVSGATAYLIKESRTAESDEPGQESAAAAR